MTSLSLCPVPVIDPHPRLPRAGLVALWDMRRISGNQVLDGSGNNRPLTLPAEPNRPDPVSEGLAFDGDDYADSGLTQLGAVKFWPAGSQPWTVAVLARALHGATNSTIIAKASTGTGYQFGIAAATDARLRINLRGLSNNFAPSDQVWHFLACYYNGANAYGVLDPYKQHSVLGIGTGAEATSERVIVGARLNGTDSFLLAGSKVAWIAVWDRALSARELRETYEFVIREFAGNGVRIGQ
jgi:hypothetical protein